ncbi:hypothetical protein [Paraburkholderia sp. HD33-4]|uniref:hypothetical protein n=1 Tax=Paraburkholderia sp. HD33-4 TaxID=2883242 RepID=UPI001F3088C5|nr:hypothetical protein [Paraburkholderia sp. HD33-4]
MNRTRDRCDYPAAPKDVSSRDLFIRVSVEGIFNPNVIALPDHCHLLRRSGLIRATEPAGAIVSGAVAEADVVSVQHFH